MKLPLFVFIFSLFLSNYSFGQVLYSHNFDNLTGFSTTEGSFCTSASCANNDNTWGLTTSVGCISGFTASTFYARDIDNTGTCGTNTTETLTFPTVPIVGNGDLIFSGNFGFDNDAINFSGTNTVTFQYSFTSATGPWTTGAAFASNGSGSMNCTTCNITGNLTADAANAFQFNLGNGQNGNTLYVQMVVSGFNGGTENFFLDDIAVTHIAPPCTAPADSPTSLLFGVPTTTTMEIGWTDAISGTDVIVIAREFGSTQTEPANGTTYTGNFAFGLGDQLGTGNYVIYSGANAGASPITVTGLAAGTNYIFSIYSFNSADNCYNIVELSGNNSTPCTAPTIQSSGLSTSSVTSSSMNVTWTNGNGNATLVVVQDASSFLTDPSNGVIYAANTIFGSGDEIGTGNYVVYNGVGTSVNITGLNPGSTYNISVYTYFSAGPCYFDVQNMISETTTTGIPMTQGTIQTCGGTFYDPGGTGNYPNGAIITTTILPETAGDAVCLDFTSWNIDYSTFGFSTLSFYDGTSAADPLIMTATGDWTVNGASAAFDFVGPGMVCATSGALTVVWNPDATGIGWEADIMCYTPVTPTVSCNINVTSNTSNICLGETAQIMANGNITSVEISNNFDDGTIGTGWSSSVAGDFSNPCGPGPDASTYFWMGTNPAPRTLSTPTYDVSSGAVISFDHKQAIQAGGNPCEGPDLVDEGVYLQYSIDGGTSWVTIHYFYPYFYTDGSTHLANWQTYNFDIPAAARTAATSFRFTQQEISSNSTDHWGLDNVSITSFNPVTFSWDNGLGIGTTQSVSPTSETTYTATISDGSNSCSASVTISMCIVLPVELAFFDVECENSNTILNWATASELNNKHFEIQASQNGIQFQTLGIVNGQGNSSQNNYYQFFDYSVQDFKYYRLSQVDFDGNTEILSTKALSTPCGVNELEITNINFSNNGISVVYQLKRVESAQVTLYDITGRLIYEKEMNLSAEKGQFDIELNGNNSQSMYILVLSTSSQRISNKIITIK